MQVDIWSDIVCPWCYVGKRRFEAALAKFAHKDEVEITWRSFELDPSSPKTYEGDGTYATRLARKYRKSAAEAEKMLVQMTATGAAEGVQFDFANARPGNTFDAHRMLHFAHANGKQGALKERFLRATFTEGAPIGDGETLVRLAQEVGLDEEAARAVMLSDDFAREVREDEATAREVGISGVPFFAIGDGPKRYGVSGAQSPEVLLQVLERAWNENPIAAPAAPGCEGEVCT